MEIREFVIAGVPDLLRTHVTRVAVGRIDDVGERKREFLNEFCVFRVVEDDASCTHDFRHVCGRDTADGGYHVRLQLYGPTKQTRLVGRLHARQFRESRRGAS